MASSLYVILEMDHALAVPLVARVVVCSCRCLLVPLSPVVICSYRCWAKKIMLEYIFKATSLPKRQKMSRSSNRLFLMLKRADFLLRQLSTSSKYTQSPVILGCSWIGRILQWSNFGESRSLLEVSAIAARGQKRHEKNIPNRRGKSIAIKLTDD